MERVPLKQTDRHHKSPGGDLCIRDSRVMGYDTTKEVCGHGFRAMACSALIESGLWSRDAVERQMSHQERNGVRAAYIHKAEHLEERRLMLQWWADFLDANKEECISPFEYAKVNNPLKR
ncbi:tyrosine-type recombinase/integrase, partial [Escherichia coli]|uniref:tyrosine-type recombinase/integrase n=1 Tax=Escherichia coli TaxID=562 RepID=UPI0039BE6558